MATWLIQKKPIQSVAADQMNFESRVAENKPSLTAKCLAVASSILYVEAHHFECDPPNCNRKPG